MRDSRLGTHGGLALIFVLVAKVLVVGELLLRDVQPHRSAGGGLRRRSRDGGTADVSPSLCAGKGLAICYWQISLQQTLTTLAIAIALATALLGLQGLRAALIALVLIGGLGWALKRTLGGQTGDTLGAAIELGEVFFLLALL